MYFIVWLPIKFVLCPSHLNCLKIGWSLHCWLLVSIKLWLFGINKAVDSSISSIHHGTYMQQANPDLQRPLGQVSTHSPSVATPLHPSHAPNVAVADADPPEDSRTSVVRYTRHRQCIMNLHQTVHCRCAPFLVHSLQQTKHTQHFHTQYV